MFLWAIFGYFFLGLAIPAASLAACIIYRRASSAMILLILAFAGDVAMAALYLIRDLGLIGYIGRFFVSGGKPMTDFMFESSRVLSFLGGLLSLAWPLTAVGLFLVLRDVVRRLDRFGAAGPDDDYRRRRPTFDQGSDPNWKPPPGGPDIQK